MKDNHKFRVWCHNNKEWEKDEILISSQNHYVVNTRERNCITTEEPKYHTISMCTGIKDKKGKLIYEGDIVIIRDYNALGYRRERIGEVEYGFGENYPAFYVTTTLGDAKDFTDDIEVIGNIYENPELLKQG